MTPLMSNLCAFHVLYLVRYGYEVNFCILINLFICIKYFKVFTGLGDMISFHDMKIECVEEH